MTASTAPVITARFAPETVNRCVMPVARKISAVSASNRDVSPTTSAGSRPRSGWGRTAHARRSPPRTRSAHAWAADGGPT